MKIRAKTRFVVGDTLHEVFWSDDIGAWDFDKWVVRVIIVMITEKGQQLFYGTESSMDMLVADSDSLHSTGLGAANEAKRRNDDAKASHSIGTEKAD